MPKKSTCLPILLSLLDLTNRSWLREGLFARSETSPPCANKRVACGNERAACANERATSPCKCRSVAYDRESRRHKRVPVSYQRANFLGEATDRRYWYDRRLHKVDSIRA